MYIDCDYQEVLLRLDQNTIVLMKMKSIPEITNIVVRRSITPEMTFTVDYNTENFFAIRSRAKIRSYEKVPNTTEWAIGPCSLLIGEREFELIHGTINELYQNHVQFP